MVVASLGGGLSPVSRKPVWGFLTKNDTKQPAQVQSLARYLKFRNYGYNTI